MNNPKNLEFVFESYSKTVTKNHFPVTADCKMFKSLHLYNTIQCMNEM